MTTKMLTLGVASSIRVYLEPLSSEEHLDDFHELWNTPDAVHFTTKLVLNSLEESRVFMLKIINNSDNPEIDKFAVMLKIAAGRGVEAHLDRGAKVKHEEGEAKMIGMVGTNRWSAEGMETGYTFNKAYWGMGFANEAFELFLFYYWTIAERKHIPRLVAKTHSNNYASIKVLARCGGRKGELVKVQNPFVKDAEDVMLQCWYFDRPVVGKAEEGK